MKFELVRPSIEMEEEYYEYIKEWENDGGEIVPISSTLRDMDFQAWLEYTDRLENRETCPENYVPANTYFLVQNQKRIIGAINIRHELNEYLLNFGGHIGYGIRPSERKKGYASLQLSMALQIAKELGIQRVLITCDKDNVASAKTIMKNGGVLENEVNEEERFTQRYWIEL